MRATSKVAYIHCLVHAESYAIDLMWDLIARFHDASLPKEFYDDWIQVRAEQADTKARTERERNPTVLALTVAYVELPSELANPLRCQSNVTHYTISP